MRRATSILALGLLAACTGTQSASSSPTERPSTPPGLELIAASYLDLADGFNAATCSFNAALSQPAPALADLKRASADYLASLKTLASGLTAIGWPAGVGADADRLVAALAANRGFAEAMARADTFDASIEADDQLIAANADLATAATQLRRDLDLGRAGDPCPT